MTEDAPDSLPVSKPIRLQRYLAQCGLGSRRDCEDLITAGRVAIDGQTAALGQSVDPSRQQVLLDGEKLKMERKKYFVLNKPSGFLCTAEDPQGRRRVLDLFPQEGPRLFTVGRLDENTTGLLIVTNDGDLAQKLAHPKHRIFRIYKAQVAGQPGPEIFEQLQKGLFFTEGKFRVYSVKPLKKQKDSTWVEIVMTEGQNREIRRLFARVGHKIMKLERTGYGPIRLGKLTIGEYRDITREELADLHAILERNRLGGPPPGGPAPGPVGPRRPGAARPSRPEGQGTKHRTGSGRPASGRPGKRSGTGARTAEGRPGERRPGTDRPASGGKPPARRPRREEKGTGGDERGGERRERRELRGGDRPRRGPPSGPPRKPGKGRRPPRRRDGE
jgi:23S rRNA pseudouridine2605 synthase